MKTLRAYDGELTGTASAAPIPLMPRGARPPRHNALGELLTDGPYEYVQGGNVNGATVVASCTVAGATVTLQATNGDPVNGPWFDVDSMVLALGASGTIAVTELAVLYLRLVGVGNTSKIVASLATSS